MGIFSDEHPYTAVTEYINRMTGRDYEDEDLSDLPDLIEIIKVQASGITESSRALRKKLKYGSVHEQIRALVILDALVMNAGKSYQRRFGDDMLLERLRTIATDQLTDKAVRTRLVGMFIGWNEEFKDVQGMSAVAHLKDSLPRRRKPDAQVRPPSPDEDDEAHERAPAKPARRQGSTDPSSLATARQSGQSSTASPTSRYKYVEPTTPPDERSGFFGSSGGKKKKSSAPSTPANATSSGPRVLSLDKEKPAILQTIASSNQAATNLNNALKHVNRESGAWLKEPAIVKNSGECKALRKKVLYYIGSITSEEWVGTLLETNDNLVAALQVYENYRAESEVPDSDEEMSAQIQREYHDEIYGAGASNGRNRAGERPPPRPKRPGAASGSAPGRPPRQQVSDSESESEYESEEEEVMSERDDDDPFANKNEDLALKTPAVEKAQPKW
ncbi:hypothetical protein PYCC9005_000993 [Savitreella phatthalungensis]